MRWFMSSPFLQTKVARPFTTSNNPRTHLYTHLKQPKANQTLKSYLKSNCSTKVLKLFREILTKSPLTIDSFSFLFVLKACTQKSSSLEGKQVHTLVIKFGFQTIVHLQTSLINMYSATRNLIDAHLMFDEIPLKNVVCWTTLISAYVDNQEPRKALQLFKQMWRDGFKPDQVTVTVALSACADVGVLEMGEWVHDYVHCEKRLNVDLRLNNSLINMYAKCGDVETARKLFNSLKEKDVTTWTSMIVGHALHGQAHKALQLFEEMKLFNINSSKNKGNRKSSLILPNDVTFIGVLVACSHVGMLKEGKQHFKSMIEVYGLKPRESHFGCMVDLFCRARLLKEAYDFILGMPMKPNAVMWRTLLGACSLQGDIKLGEEVRHKLSELEPSHVSDYVAMSNIYAANKMWDEKIVVRDQIRHRRAPGCSTIEVGNDLSEFVAADFDHPLKMEIYEVLKHLNLCMKTHGYFPDTHA